MRLQLRDGEGVAPVVLDVQVGQGGDGRSGPSRIIEVLRRETGAERGARYGHSDARGQRGTLGVVDRCAGKLLRETIHRVHRVNRGAVVVSFERGQQRGRWTDDGDVGRGLREWKDAAVLEQHKGLFGRLQREGAMRCGRDLARRDFTVGIAARRVQQTELGASGEEAFCGGGDQGFGDDTVAHRFCERVEAGRPDGAGKVRAGLERDGRRMENVRCVMVALGDIDDRSAVGDDEALELPGVAEMLLQEHGVIAGRLAIDGVVGAHHRLDVSLHHGRSEGRQVCLFEIARGNVDVEGVALRFGTGVNGEVLAGGDRLWMVCVVTLHAFDKSDAHATRQERIFAVSFLSAAPTWIAKDVDVGRPEGQAVEDEVVALSMRQV